MPEPVDQRVIRLVRPSAARSAEPTHSAASRGGAPDAVSASHPPPVAPPLTVPTFAVAAFLAYLGAKAVSVSLSGDDLRVVGPLTDADRATLVTHRRAVIEALSRAKIL